MQREWVRSQSNNKITLLPRSAEYHLLTSGSFRSESTAQQHKAHARRARRNRYTY
eukprot:COSAG01_NODE_48494_length_380_cov_9.523132_1_plen_54_part_10